MLDYKPITDFLINHPDGFTPYDLATTLPNFLTVELATRLINELEFRGIVTVSRYSFCPTCSLTLVPAHHRVCENHNSCSNKYFHIAHLSPEIIKSYQDK